MWDTLQKILENVWMNTIVGLTKTIKPHVPWKTEVIVSFYDQKCTKAFENYLKVGSGYVFAKRHFWSNP